MRPPDVRDEPRPTDPDEEHIGLFGSWRTLYIIVIAYTAGLTVLLYVLSRILDHSG